MIINNNKTLDIIGQGRVISPVAIKTASKRILKIRNKEDSLEYKESAIELISNAELNSLIRFRCSSVISKICDMLIYVIVQILK